MTILQRNRRSRNPRDVRFNRNGPYIFRVCFHGFLFLTARNQFSQFMEIHGRFIPFIEANLPVLFFDSLLRCSDTKRLKGIRTITSECIKIPDNIA
jgi:hypothetical protein